MKIFLIQVALPLVTYAIGVFIGRRYPIKEQEQSGEDT